MRTLAEVLQSPVLADLAVLTEGGLSRPVRTVQIAESLSAVAEAAPDSLVILTTSAAPEVGSYRFEIVLRRASSGGMTALAAPIPAETLVPRTSLALADRGAISLLRISEGADLAELVLAAGRAVAAGAEAALAILERSLDDLVELERGGAAEAAVLERVRGSLPDVEVRTPGPDDVWAPVLVHGTPEQTLVARTRGDARDVAARVVLHLAAGLMGRIRTAARRAEEAPIRSVAELLTELMAADPTRSPRLLNRARSLGLPVDGWHVVARVEIDELDGGDEATALELQETVATLALRIARASGGSWHVARSESAVLLVRMHESDPGPTAAARVAAAVERAVAGVRERFPGRPVRGGVGSVHAGPTGLRASAAEARAAIGAARTTGRGERVTSYDVVGLERMLLEWYASDTARESVHALLGPLERLGPKKAETAIRTLQTYLDEQGSIARTARALFLHRNAVAYRIRRIEEALGVDLSDPNQRLALQLACRARMLGAPKARSAAHA